MKRIICAVCLLVMVMTLCAPAVCAAPDLNSIEAYLEENKDTIAGAAVIQIENGEIAGAYYYGFADIENGLAVDEATVFEWASITKLLVWTSVMQLVEQGKLELEQDIRAYLPQRFLTKLSYSKPITMLNLMHHNAGWADSYKNMDVLSPAEVIELDEALKKCEPRQIYEPGTVVAYSNYGVALAGYIVERVSGQPCWQYVNENIFAPLGMKNTAIHPAQADNPGIGAARDKEQAYGWERNYIPDHRTYCNLYPCGAAIGTIEDMAKFAMALLPPADGDSPLFNKRETLEFMLTPSLYYPDNSPENAHGFWVEWRSGGEFYGHGGNTAFSCNLLFEPQTREALLVMTNTAGEQVLCSGLMDELLGPAALLYETDPQAAAGTAREVTGIYMFARHQVDTYSVVDYRLFDPIIVSAQDDRAIKVSFWGEYQQVAPYVFKGGRGDILRFAATDGKVTKIATMTTDLLKRPAWQLVFDYALFGLAVLAVIYCLVMLCLSGWRKLKKKAVTSRLSLARNIAGAFCLAVGLNWGLFKLATTNRLPPSAGLIIFLTINVLTLPACVAYVWFLLKTDKTKYSKAEIRSSVIAGMGILVELIAVVAFSLWR